MLSMMDFLVLKFTLSW